MPIFENTAVKPLNFYIAEDHYKVPVGKATEIPQKYIYVVKRRGLALKPVAKTEMEVVQPVPRVYVSRHIRGTASGSPDPNNHETVMDGGDDSDSELQQQLSAVRKRAGG